MVELCDLSFSPRFSFVSRGSKVFILISFRKCFRIYPYVFAGATTFCAPARHSTLPTPIAILINAKFQPLFYLKRIGNLVATPLGNQRMATRSMFNRRYQTPRQI